MRIPNWYELLLLSFAAFRVYRLISEDTILDRPRAWVLGMSGWVEGKPTPKTFKPKWAEFITCPWCAGFWVSVLWWIAWNIWPHATIVVAVPWVISTIVALSAKNLDESE